MSVSYSTSTAQFNAAAASAESAARLLAERKARVEQWLTATGVTDSRERERYATLHGLEISQMMNTAYLQEEAQRLEAQLKAARAKAAGGATSDVVVTDDDYFRSLAEVTGKKEEELRKKEEEERRLLLEQLQKLQDTKDGEVTIGGSTYTMIGGQVQVREGEGYRVSQQLFDSLGPEVKAAYGKPLVAPTYRERIAEAATNLSGIHEVGYNGGDITRLVGCQGLPWCGGPLPVIFSRAGLGGAFPQTDFRMASSFTAMGQKYGALRRDQNYQVGDVVIMPGAGPSGQHPGIVVAANADSITIVSGNHGDKMARFTIPRNSHRIVARIDMDEYVKNRNRDGNAVYDQNGQAITNLNADALPDRLPYEWEKSAHDRYKAGRTQGTRDVTAIYEEINQKGTLTVTTVAGIDLSQALATIKGSGLTLKQALDEDQSGIVDINDARQVVKGDIKPGDEAATLAAHIQAKARQLQANPPR